MIKGFQHKGLRRFFEQDDTRGIQSDHQKRINRILSVLDDATTVQDAGLPGFDLHPLKGDKAGYWAVSVSGNWRIIFTFEDGHADNVDLTDYH